MDTGKMVLVGVVVALAGGAAIVGARTWSTPAEPVETEPVAVVEVEPAPPALEQTFARSERLPDPVEELQNEPRQQRGDRQGGRRSGEDWRKQMMSRFDADGDGEISDEERQTAREAMQARRDEMRAQWVSRWDKDGDGELSEEEMGEARAEREKARQEFEAVLADRFDTDGDGELSDIEREAARTAIRTEARDYFNSFDSDGDGQLSDTERQTARDELQRRDAQRKALATLDSDKDGAILSAEATDAIARVHLGDPSADYNADGVVDERDAQVVMDQFTGAGGQESLFDTMRSRFGRGGFGGGFGGDRGRFQRDGGQNDPHRPTQSPPGDG